MGYPKVAIDNGTQNQTNHGALKLTQACWGYPQDYYHRDIGEGIGEDAGIPECGVALDPEEDGIGIGDTNDFRSMPIGLPKCPECLWLPDNPNQTDLFR